MKALTMSISRAVVVFAGVLSLAVPAAATDVPTTIAGKPYSTTPGAGGTYTVKWGDDSMTWDPNKVWYYEAFKKAGPTYYAKWTEKGLPFPFELSMEERAKLPGDELYDRCIAWHYYGSYYKGGADMWNNLVVKPDGSLREKQYFMEHYMAFNGKKNQEYLTPEERDDVSHKYMWIAVEPQEVRGQSGVTTDYYARDKRPSDTLYLPTVRKVRRLAGSVSKQFFPATILRYEDVSHVRALADLDYKVVGYELYKTDPKVHGEGPNDYPDIKGFDGAGDVAAIIEITPKPGVSWWYGKRKFWCGLQTLAYLHSEEFDDKGAPQRYVVHRIKSGVDSKLGDGKPAPDWYFYWGALWGQDQKSGFRGDMWASDVVFDAEFPTNIFSNENLLREPRQLGWWKK
jgi:hypothetical protein